MAFPPPAFQEIQGSKLTPAARLVWLCLRLSNEPVRVAERDLGELIGLTQATVHAALEQLQEMGLVRVLEARSGTRSATLLAMDKER
jgi:DNA-binding MarR family transcriptional regulator